MIHTHASTLQHTEVAIEKKLLISRTDFRHYTEEKTKQVYIFALSGEVLDEKEDEKKG